MKTNSKAGFTLIELMVVVAIVGILATIAISGVKGWIGKARQAEAKAALGSLFTVQKIFHREFQSYTYCIKQAGFTSVSPKRYYYLGTQADALFACGPNGTVYCAAYGYSPVVLCDDSCPAPAGNDVNTYATLKNSSAAAMLTCANAYAEGVPVSGPGAWTLTKDAFVLGAAGNISDSPIYDMWTIDHLGQIVNSQPGL